MDFTKTIYRDLLTAPFLALFLLSLCLAVFAHLNQVSPIVRAFFTFPFILFFPIRIGSLFLNALLKAAGWKKMSLTGLSLIFLLWMMGGLVLSMILDAIGMLNNSSIFYATVYALVVLALFPIRMKPLDASISHLLRSRTAWVAILTSLASVVPIYLYRLNSPFPYMTVFDQFGYSGQVLSMISGQTVYVPVLPLLIPLISMISIIFVARPIELFWALPFLQYIIMSGAVFVLAYRLFRHVAVATLAGLVVVWFPGWGQVDELYGVFPKIMIYLIFPLVLFLIDASSADSHLAPNKRLFLVITAPFIFLVLSYPVIYVGLANEHLPSYLLMPFYPFFVLEGSHFTAASSILYLQSYFALIVSMLLGALAVLHNSLVIHRRASAVYLVCSFFSIAAHPEMGSLVAIFALSMWMGPFALRRLGVFRGPIFVVSLIVGVLYYLEKVFFPFGMIGAALVTVIEWVPLKISISGLEIYRFVFPNTVRVWQQTIGAAPMVIGFLGVIISFFIKRNTRPIFLPAVLLVSFFLLILPWPASYRMLYYATPILAIFIGIIASPVLFTTKNILTQTSTSKNPRNISSTIIDAGFKAMWVILVMLLVLSPLVASRSDFQKYLSQNYSRSGVITSYTEDDLRAASWVRSLADQEPIILTDPITLGVVTGLSGLMYSIAAREQVSAFGAAEIWTSEANSIRGLITWFSFASLAPILSRYSAYDQLLKGASSNHTVLIIVNWRTSSWVHGRDPSFITSFQQFIGLNTLLHTDGITLSFFAGKDYYVFRVNPLVASELHANAGPSVSVYTDNSSSPVALNTSMTYYVRQDVNYSLSLTGYRSYNVTNYPVQWTVSQIAVNGRQFPAFSDINFNILVTNLQTSDVLYILWGADLTLTNIIFKDDSFMKGWSAGPPSLPSLRAYSFSTANSTLDFSVGPAPLGYYASLQSAINLNPNLKVQSLQLGVSGDQGSEINVEFIFMNGSAISLTNGWSSPPTRSARVTLLFAPVQASQISRAALFLKTTSGATVEMQIEYILVAAS